MDPYRLPRSVIPSRYDLYLEPDLEAARFSGSVAIRLRVEQTTDVVLLNAIELEIDSAEYTPEGVSASTPTIALEEQTERCRLTFPAPLAVGQGVLTLRFRGALNDKLRGFYRSRYRTQSGDWAWLAATQFEATDARRAFPCWDEPSFKAVFASTLSIPGTLQAVSNTAVIDDRIVGDRRVLTFADSIVMSSYLVAYIVGDLQSSKAVFVGKTPVRVWTVPGKQHLTAFGHDIGVASLRFFEEYYDRPYPGDKLDLIAIPDFAAGAMENLGAITFRETALLVDQATATHQEKERVADVVAHENAHMWFGDLVTMSWWNGLWLNEAFATFMEMLAVDAWKPQWGRWTTFGVSRSAAFTVDGLHSSRPIEFPVSAPRDADAMFDVLTYEKGASVLRMLEQFLGEEVFRDGVRRYLARHAYANTETIDLWNALQEAVTDRSLDLPTLMNGWIFQAGYPVVSARLEAGQLILRQQRFTYLPLSAEQSPTQWQVPIRVRFGGPKGQLEKVLLANEEVRLPAPAEGEPVLVNAGGHGFYRVRYEAELLTRLGNRLTDYQPIERFNLVNDEWAGVLAGHTRLEAFLDLIKAFGSDRDRNVWSVLLGAFGTLSRILEESDRPAFQAFVRARVGPLAKELGWQPQPGEDELAGQLRGDLLRVVGILGDDPEIQKAAALVKPGEADLNVEAVLPAILAHTGGADRYDEMLDRFRTAKTPQEEQRYLQALAGFREEALVDRTLALILDGTVRSQDAPLLLRSLLLGVHSRGKAWLFVQSNAAELTRRFPGPGLRRLCDGFLGLATETWLAEVRALFAAKLIEPGGKTAEQICEQLQITVELRRREGSTLGVALRLG